LAYQLAILERAIAGLPRHMSPEIQAAQERHNAGLADVTEQPTLKVAKRYASGRPR
jgi:hypothetical protein